MCHDDGSEYVDKVDGSLGRAYIIVYSILGELCAAFLTREYVIAGIGPSETYLSLDAPMLGENPGVAVSHARTGIPSLVAAVAKIAEIVAEKIKAVLPTAKVVLTAEQVEADKMAREAVAEPITGLGLNEPVFPAASVVEGPSVVIAREVKTPLRGKSNLGTEVDGQGGIIKKVGLDIDLSLDRHG